jgi:hypothetical protein
VISGLHWLNLNTSGVRGDGDSETSENANELRCDGDDSQDFRVGFPGSVISGGSDVPLI